MGIVGNLAVRVQNTIETDIKRVSENPNVEASSKEEPDALKAVPKIPESGTNGKPTAKTNVLLFQDGDIEVED